MRTTGGTNHSIIALDRRFLRVLPSADGMDPDEVLPLSRALDDGERWDELLEHPYVVVLGEAGTGKTTEFTDRARQRPQRSSTKRGCRGRRSGKRFASCAVNCATSGCVFGWSSLAARAIGARTRTRS